MVTRAYNILTAFTITPINITVCSGSSAQFMCSASNVYTVYYSVISTSVPPLLPQFKMSAPTYIGGATIVNMSISNASANAVITCHAYLVNETWLTRAAYLIVQGTVVTHAHLCCVSQICFNYISGPPSAPTDLNIATYNSATLLAWGPPPDAQSPSLLSYAVVIRNGSGAPVYSETVREPQLVITTPDPCDHYEATVTPMCGSITGDQTSPMELESEFMETACVFIQRHGVSYINVLF